MPRLVPVWLLWLAFSVSQAFASPNVPAEPGQGTAARPREYRFQRGDDPAWASPTYDDTNWPVIGRMDVPSRDGVFWLRTRVDLRDDPGSPPIDTLSLAAVASYEVYWDGRFIGRNGHVGNSPSEEKTGAVDCTFQIPDDLARPGDHLLAFRMSSYHAGFPSPTFGVFPRVQAHRDYLLRRIRTTAFSLVAVGGALVVGLVFGFVWMFADRRPATGLFSLACFTAAVQQALQAWRGLVDYPYSWHYPRTLAITLLMGVLGLLLIAFVQAFLQAPRTRLRLAGMLLLLAAGWHVSPMYNVKAVFMSAEVLVVALLIAIQAWRAKRPGAGFVLIGLLNGLIGLAASPADFVEHSFVFSSGVAMLGYVVAFTRQWQEERRAARQAQLTAARLEIELLKKNIQPHFVLNTLATIMEVVEQDPKAAVALIDALASEFRILNRVSGEKLIPLEQELELCRAHLHVMSLRKGAACALTIQGPSPDALVPPALFLTLVENGLTHLLPRNGRLDFTLVAGGSGSTTRYDLCVEGVCPEDVPAAVRDGTGMRYIKARLEESYTGRWSVSSHPTPTGWRTTIEITGESTGARSLDRDAAEPERGPRRGVAETGVNLPSAH